MRYSFFKPASRQFIIHEFLRALENEFFLPISSGDFEMTRKKRGEK